MKFVFKTIVGTMKDNERIMNRSHEIHQKSIRFHPISAPSWLVLELRGSAQQRLLGAQAAHEAVEAAAAERVLAEAEERAA